MKFLNLLAWILPVCLDGGAASTCAYSTSWTYATMGTKKTNGNWKDLPTGEGCTHDCAKTTAQSPINVEVSKAETAPTEIKLEFEYHNNGGNDWKARTNDPLAFHADCTDCSLRINAKSPTAAAKTYKLLGFHFHTASEHQIDGAHYPGELHLVHQDITGDPNYLVVGMMLQPTSTASEVGQWAKDVFGANGYEYGESNALKVTDAADWESLFKSGMPLAATNTFYQYSGGFTTPPCTEAVQWHVMATPLKVHQKTIDAHHKINGKTVAGVDSVKAVSQNPDSATYNTSTANRGNNRVISANSGKVYKASKITKSSVISAKSHYEPYRPRSYLIVLALFI